MITKTTPTYPTEPPWDEIDPGISERVMMLYASGLRPVASCEGHGGDPWVNVLETDVQKVYDALADCGQDGFSLEVVHAFPYPLRDACDVYCRVRWWRHD